MKCDYKHCLCPECDELIGGGKSKFHQKCLDTRADIKEISKMFVDYVDRPVVHAQLGRVINTIIFSNGIDSEYLKFGLQLYIDRKIPLNYPGGLYYVMQSKDVKDAWIKRQAKKEQQKIREEINNMSVEHEVHNFGYQQKKNKTIANLLGD